MKKADGLPGVSGSYSKKFSMRSVNSVRAIVSAASGFAVGSRRQAAFRTSMAIAQHIHATRRRMTTVSMRRLLAPKDEFDEAIRHSAGAPGIAKGDGGSGARRSERRERRRRRPRSVFEEIKSRDHTRLTD